MRTLENLSTLAHPFQYGGRDIRIAVDDRGMAWFCAMDVFEALEIEWKGNGSLENFPERWQGVLPIRPPGGTQEAVFISEAATYRVVFYSNKPEAETFAEWISEDVLPALRLLWRGGQPATAQSLSIGVRHG